MPDGVDIPQRQPASIQKRSRNYVSTVWFTYNGEQGVALSGDLSQLDNPDDQTVFARLNAKVQYKYTVCIRSCAHEVNTADVLPVARVPGLFDATVSYTKQERQKAQSYSR